MFLRPTARSCEDPDFRKAKARRCPRTLTSAVVIALSLVAVAPSAVFAQKKKVVIGTLGAAQMKGGDGLIGTTYTLTDGNGFLVNATLTKLEYSVTRYNIDKSDCLVPKTGEKILILHWQLQNSNTADEYFGRNPIPFSTVASDGQTRNHPDYQRLAGAKDVIGLSLKPGQRMPDELLAAGIVPADGPVPKLIVNLGRKGTSEKVTRYMLGKAPNIVKPLPVGDADPADKTGATALTAAPAKIGAIYPMGRFDWTVSSIAFVPGPIGDKSAGTGKRFLVATVTLTNRAWSPVYTYLQYLMPASLLTADDEKTTNYQAFKGKRDEPAAESSVDPGESVTFRLAFIVPNDTTGKKLTIAEGVDNSGGKTRALVFDLTSIH